MASEGAAISMLVFRLIALAASVATIVLIVTNNVKYTFKLEDVVVFEFHAKFQDLIAYRYVLAVAAISAAYGIIQLPFAVYYAVNHKRLIRHGCLPNFDFIADKVISLLLATAIGVGIGVSYEAKRLLDVDHSDDPDPDPITSKQIKFLNRGTIASSVLALACLCMAIVSVISSIIRSRRK